MKHLITYEKYNNVTRNKIYNWMVNNRLDVLDITDWNIKEGKLPIYILYVVGDKIMVSSVIKRGDPETDLGFFGNAVLNKIWIRMINMTEDDIEMARAENEADKFGF